VRLLLPYLAPIKWVISFSLLFGTISKVFYMLEPHLLGIVIDEFASRPHERAYRDAGNNLMYVKENPRTEKEYVSGITTYLILIFAVNIVATFSRVSQDYFTKKVVIKFGNFIYTDALKHSMKLSFEEFENQKSGETLKSIAKLQTDAEKFLTALLNIFFNSIVAIVFVSIYTFHTHWSLFLFYLSAYLTLIFISLIMTVKMKKVERTLWGEVKQLAGSATESFQNALFIKSFGLIHPLVSRLKQKILTISELELNIMKRLRVLSIINGGVIKFAIMFIMFWLFFLTYDKGLTPGRLITLSLYSTIIFMPFHQIGHIILYYRELQISGGYLLSIKNKTPPAVAPDAIHIDDIKEIQFVNVSYKHHSAKLDTLVNINFKVKIGQTIAFTGPSGAGKTTLLKLVTGLYEVQKGDILYNGVPIQSLAFDDLRSALGLVTQQPYFFSYSIRENLLFVNPTANEEEIQDALLKAGCQSFVKRCKDGIDTLIGEGGAKLSGGEKQRLAIARALLRNPKLLIFDEATSSLDSLGEESVNSVIRNICSENKLISILIAHRISTIMHADIIYVIERGRIQESGTHEELIKMKGLYFAMWRQQIGERN
jgi:ATP-binding cassette, subfamily B, bacterial